jgi:hypothetical protein
MSAAFSAAFKTALEFAGHGHRVFPTFSVKDGACTCPKRRACDSPGKHPLTRHGFQDATTNERKLLQWNERWRDANWAVVCGSDFVVIDVDPKAGAEPREVIGEYGLQGRPTVWTGRASSGPLEDERGAHVYCEGGTRSGSPRAGVQVKGEGGYVMVPGSRHVSGEQYEWAGAARPWTTELEPLPEPLRPAHRRPEPPPLGGPIKNGTRHETLKALAVWLVTRGVTDPDVIRGALLEVNRRRCQPPLDRAEVVAIAAWAARSKIAANERRIAKAPVMPGLRLASTRGT